MKLKVDFTPPPDPLPRMTDEQKQRLWYLYERFGNHGSYEKIERIMLEADMRDFSQHMLGFVVNKMFWGWEFRCAKEVCEMRELNTKGVEELNKLRNRVARLYGMGRITKEDFDKLDTTINSLAQMLKEVREIDDNIA
jgi:hypothetical protein